MKASALRGACCACGPRCWAAPACCGVSPMGVVLSPFVVDLVRVSANAAAPSPPFLTALTRACSRWASRVVGVGCAASSGPWCGRPSARRMPVRPAGAPAGAAAGHRLRDVFCVYRTEQGDAAALQGVALEWLRRGAGRARPERGQDDPAARRRRASRPRRPGWRGCSAPSGGLSPRRAADVPGPLVGIVDQHYDARAAARPTCAGDRGRRPAPGPRASAARGATPGQDAARAGGARRRGGRPASSPAASASAWPWLRRPRAPARAAAGRRARRRAQRHQRRQRLRADRDLAADAGATVVIVSHDPAVGLDRRPRRAPARRAGLGRARGAGRAARIVGTTTAGGCTCRSSCCRPSGATRPPGPAGAGRRRAPPAGAVGDGAGGGSSPARAASRARGS